MTDQHPYLSGFSTPAELAAEYVAVLRSGDHHRMPSIVEACLQGPLPDALHEIARWRHVWATIVVPGYDPMEGPEVALRLSVTSKGNLNVLWEPMMTMEQYQAAPAEFRHWLRSLSAQQIAQRRDNQVYFLKEYRDLKIRVYNQEQWPLTPLQRIEAHCVVALVHDLASRLRPLVRAHWQDVLVTKWTNYQDPGPVRPLSMDIHKAWAHLSGKTTERRDRTLAAVGGDRERLDQAWEEAGAQPRVRTESTQAKAAGKILGVAPDAVLSARHALEQAAKWPEHRPRLWWNREKFHSRDRLFH